MDAKITKKRLADNLQYDWIKILVFIVAAIFLLELVYTVSAVRVKTGQNFKVYYGSGVRSNNAASFYKLLDKEDVLSYDVFEKNVEVLTSEYESTVLSARMSVAEGDIILLDNVLTYSATESKKEDKRAANSSFKNMVNSYSMYDFDSLISDAEKYLSKFYVDGTLDKSKVEEHFRTRMKKDNRFKKESKIKEGVLLEINRIEVLKRETDAFKYLLETYSDSGLFAEYVRFENMYFNELSDEDYSKVVNGEAPTGEYEYKAYYEQETAKKYAINCEFLTGGKNDIVNLFAVGTNTTGKDAYIMVFNFLDKQPDLQFEVIPVINEIVRTYSNLFDGYNA